ncbi:MAG: glycosyltransferase family protein [Candidatus Thermoplasmatota archaeon]
MNIIYGICSWGLGHATRSLPVIRQLLKEDNKLTVISHGRTLELLKKELKDQVDYYAIQDYPLVISENTRQMLAKSMLYWPVFIHRIESGLRSLQKILEEKKYDCILSDARYDMYSKKIPSYFISHQMRIMNPLRMKILENGSELFNQFFFQDRFKKVIVPDYETDDLSGDLSHNLKKINEKQLHYVGVLSDFQKKQTKKDIDYFISISGPEPQRTLFEKKIMSQLDTLQGTIVVSLGKTENIHHQQNDTTTIYSYLKKEEREEVFNRTKLVISRSGYSTIMDLAVLGIHGLMIPTPGQIEQEYLGHYHTTKKTFYSVGQNNLDLARDSKYAQKTTGITRTCDVSKTVEAIIRLITY